MLRAADNLIGGWRNDRAKELVLESLKQSLRLTGASCGNELRSRERERERGAVLRSLNTNGRKENTEGAQERKLLPEISVQKKIKKEEKKKSWSLS